MKEIVNKVAKSGLITINLEDYYAPEKQMLFDLKDFLIEDLILIEKDFREKLKAHDWSVYQNAHVAIHCSSEAILPAWAFLLVSTYLHPVARRVVQGNLETLNLLLFQEKIDNINTDEYEGERIIIKGCGDKNIPSNAYIALIQKLQPVAKRLMYGEACSTVPLYIKKRSDA